MTPQAPQAPQNLVSIIVSYVPPYNIKGSRVKLSFPLKGKSRFIPYDHEFDSCEAMAVDYLSKAGAMPLARTCLAKGNDVALLFPFTCFDALSLAICKR